MKTQNRVLTKLIGVVLLCFSLTTGCNKDDGGNGVVLAPPGTVVGGQNCSTCPTNLNKITTALGSTRNGFLDSEFGLTFYTDGDVASSNSIIGSAVTIAGYFYVRRDDSFSCYLREGHYNVETTKEGTVNGWGNFVGIEFLARHVGTDEVVHMSFPFIGYMSLVPVRVSTIDNLEYNHSLTGDLAITNLTSAAINCTPNAFYKIAKPL